jgi:Ni,Fe-hydrogenase III large subunit/Ni,Fe-hydrogenase III component G
MTEEHRGGEEKEEEYGDFELRESGNCYKAGYYCYHRYYLHAARHGVEEVSHLIHSGASSSSIEKYAPAVLEKFGARVVEAKDVARKNDNEVHIRLNDSSRIPDVCLYICSSLQFRLSCMDCIDDRRENDHFLLRYLFTKERENVFLAVTAPIPSSATSFPSITLQIASAALYEREIKDMFGLVPSGNPDTRMLVAHEFWPKDLHPLRKDAELKPATVRNNQGVIASAADGSNDDDGNGDDALHHVGGDGVCEIPLGPVYAGITEPAHFRLSILGEEIVNVENRLFYSHRGIEKLAEGRRFEDVLLLSERIAGDESVANSLAFCQALEKMAKITIPQNAAQTRVVCAELERIYNHLGTIAGLSSDVGYAYGSARLNVLKERIMQLNEHISGSRILFGTNRVGGVNVDITGDRTRRLILDTTVQLDTDFEKLADLLRRKSSFIDRLRGTGAISRKAAADLGAVGVAARAAGIDIDTRRDQPYAGYSTSYVPRQEQEGEEMSDALSRLEIRIQEIKQSIEIIRRAVDNIDENDKILFSSDYDDIRSRIEPSGNALGCVESPRGQTIHWVSIGGKEEDSSNKAISRYKIRTASFCNWALIEHAIHGDIILDFPVILRSFDLSSAGNDL